MFEPLFAPQTHNLTILTGHYYSAEHISQLVHSVICQWAFWLIPPFGHCELIL